MSRFAIENVLLSLMPTAIYLAYVLLTRRTTGAGNVFDDAPLV